MYELAEHPTSRAGRIIATTLAVVLAGLAVWSVAAQRADETAMPTPEALASAREAILPNLEQGDIIRAYPWWYDDSRIGFDGVPFLMSRDIDRYWLSSYERMWVVYPPRYESNASEAIDVLEDIETLVETDEYIVRVGSLSLGESVLWDAREELHDARVAQVAPDGHSTRCTRWRDETWGCGRIDPWVNVSRSLREMDDSYRQCVYAGPPPDQKRWQVTWDNVTLGNVLRARAGNTMYSARHLRGGTVHFRLLLGDQVISERSFAPDEIGYPEFVVDTSSRAGDVGSVTIEVWADEHWDRYFCVEAQTVLRD